MNMLGNKIDGLKWKPAANVKSIRPKTTLVSTALTSVFLFFGPACVMTKAQGEKLATDMRNMETEVAKLQSVRHDMEILLKGNNGMVDRLARLENQLTNLKESLNDDSGRNMAMLEEVQRLRGQLEESEYRYRTLEEDQRSLAENQLALKAETKKIKIPPLKEDHFALAKKLSTAAKYDDANFLLDEYIKEYSNSKDKESVGQAYFMLGENNRKIAENKTSDEEKEKYNKLAVVHYQKIVESFKGAVLREEALFKIGSVLKAMGNIEGARAAFEELLSSNKTSKRATEAKKQLASLKE